MIAKASNKGYLVGPVWEPVQITELAIATGWTNFADFLIATAIAFAECDGYINSYNDNLDDTGKVVSRDVGLWEINIAAAQIGTDYEKQLYDPVINAKAAYLLWERRGWEPWSSFTSGVVFDDTYIFRALLGVTNYGAGLLKTKQLADPARATTHTLELPLISIAQLASLYPHVPL